MEKKPFKIDVETTPELLKNKMSTTKNKVSLLVKNQRLMAPIGDLISVAELFALCKSLIL